MCLALMFSVRGVGGDSISYNDNFLITIILCHSCTDYSFLINA